MNDQKHDNAWLSVIVLTFSGCLFLGMLACDNRRSAGELDAATKAKGVAAVAVIQQQKPTPAPQPAPQPGDVCPNCKGRGEVGDGTIMRKCVVCDGKGKLAAEPEPREEKSILARLMLNEAALENMSPAVPVRAVLIVKKDHCPPCELMKAEIEQQLVPLGWLASNEPAAAPDILIANGWPGHGENEADVYPTTLIQVEGATVKTLRGYHDWNRLAHEINTERKKPRAEKFNAIPGGSVAAKDEIGQALEFADKFLGNGGSLTFARPAGTVELPQATVTFTAATTITMKHAADTILLTCNPPPRIKLAKIPLLAPGVNAITIGRERILVDLLRWPDVTIQVR